MANTNVQNPIKGLKQKIPHQFVPPDYISSDQGTLFITDNAPQGAERGPPQYKFDRESKWAIKTLVV